MIWFRQRHICKLLLWLLSCYSEFYLSHNSWHKATTEVTTLELGCFLCTFLLVQCTKSQREENDRVHPKCARCIDPSCTVVWLPLSSLSLWRQRTTRGGERLPRNVPLLSDRYYSQLAALNTAEQMNRAEFHFQKTFSTHPDKRLYSSFSPWQLWFHRPLVKPPFDRKGEAGSQAGERVSGNFIRTGARVGW